MCLILFAYRVHPVYRLVLAANRDEFYRRPTQPAQWWEECPKLLGGRDLQGGGSWLALDRRGRLAALTNVRSTEDLHPRGRSRGLLVSDFLQGEASAASVADDCRQTQEYAGFNLLLMDGEGLFHTSNRGATSRLEPGCYGLSNAQLDTPWPKVVRGRERFAALLQADGEMTFEPLLTLLADERRAADAELPQTGVGLETERLLSAIFIRSAEYGTRSSTVVLQRHDGATLLVERTFTPGELGGEVCFAFAAVPF